MKNLIARSDALDKRIVNTDTNIDAGIEALVTASKRNRKLINWVIVSIIFETVLAGAVIFSVIRTTSNTLRLNQTRSILINNCTVGNDFRSSEASLWNYILSIPSDQPSSPEQQERVKSFKAFLDKTFAPRDCSNL